MRSILGLLLVGALVGCATPKPVNVLTGDACWRCRRPIENLRLAGEMVEKNGLGLKFRTIHCMSTWIAQQKTAPSGVFYVTNYSDGKWLRADGAMYVRTVVNPNTMEQDFIAFADRATAENAAQSAHAPVVDWNTVLDAGRSTPLGGN